MKAIEEMSVAEICQAHKLNVYTSKEPVEIGGKYIAFANRVGTPWYHGSEGVHEDERHAALIAVKKELAR